jgi:putative membrane protein
VGSPAVGPPVFYAPAMARIVIEQRKPADRKPPMAVRWGIAWLTNAVVLGVVVALLKHVTVSGAGALLAAAAVFGILNTVLKPFLRVVTLPLAIVTLGVAWFFVSLLMLIATRAIVGGFQIHGFAALVEATIIIWLVNVLLDLTPGPWQLTGRRRQIRQREPSQ